MVENSELSFPSFNSGDQVLIHRLYNETDRPNPKPNSPWYGPYTVRARLFPVTYRVSIDNEPAETTIHLGRIKKHIVPSRPLSPI